MSPHVHVDFVDLFTFALKLVIVLALLRLLAAHFSDSTIGKGLGAVVA